MSFFKCMLFHPPQLLAPCGALASAIMLKFAAAAAAFVVIATASTANADSCKKRANPTEELIVRDTLTRARASAPAPRDRGAASPPLVGPRPLYDACINIGVCTRLLQAVLRGPRACVLLL